ncbi:MAG: MmcQ/YjbR family DNA-binding protein [Natronosporangium sp.]
MNEPVENLRRVGAMVAGLPETERVDVESWDGEPTFRVRGKVFVFGAPDGSGITVKLPREEAEALVATDPAVSPAGYGLGRHGWVSVRLGTDPGREPDAERWRQVEEWVRSSYALVAPKRLARLVES